MLKKMVMGLALIAATALVVPAAAYAKGGGHGGGGKWHGGGGKWHGGGGKWHGAGKWHGGNWHAGKWHGKWRGHGWRGYGYGVPIGVAAGYYAAPYYDDCYQSVRVITPYGPRFQMVNVCY